MHPLPALAALLALAALPLAAAGTPEAPEVTDGAGDVAFFGAPVPQGLEWSDLQAAWFTRDGDDLTLSIRVGDGAEPPQAGEVGVTFRAGEQHYIAGYTVFPPLYSGGFLSLADADGDVPAGASPRSMDGTFQDGLIVVRFTAQDLEDPGNVTSFAGPWGWSESRATNGETWRLDRTDVGMDFSWLPSETRAPDAGAAADGDARDSPVPLLLAPLAVALAAWGRRRHG